MQYLQPSIYDSIIMIKELPYLPDLKGNKSYNLTVADMMRTNIYFVSYRSTYAELRQLLNKSNFRSYPLVDSPSMYCVFTPVCVFGFVHIAAAAAAAACFLSHIIGSALFQPVPCNSTNDHVCGSVNKIYFLILC